MPEETVLKPLSDIEKAIIEMPFEDYVKLMVELSKKIGEYSPSDREMQ